MVHFFAQQSKQYFLFFIVLSKSRKFIGKLAPQIYIQVPINSNHIIDSQLNPQQNYQFIKTEVKQDFYFNSYTDEAKYIDRRNKIKAMEPANKEEFYFQELEIEEPKKDVMDFLKEIESYYISLNIFTDVLVCFGRGLRFIEKSSIFQKNTFYFSKFQEFYPPEYPYSQMKKSQLQIFQSAKTLPLKSKDNKKILLPTWENLLQLIKYIGGEYQKIESMRRSNSEMLEMIHKKVLEDFSLLEKRLIQVGKELNENLKNLKDMRKDYNRYQDMEINNVNDTNQIHMEMMQWVKRRYYEFRDLEKRIKQNQVALKQRTALRGHLQKKLNQFRSVSQKAFMKTVKTRYIALLDSYHITVDESIKQIQQSLKSYGFEKQPQKPKVKDIQINKNVNSALQAQKKYQQEYFQRIQYFVNIGQGLILSMASLGDFVGNLQGVFGEIIVNLKASHMNKEKMANYFTQLTKALLQRSLQIYNELCHLFELNKKFKSQNQPQLQYIISQISLQKQASHTLLSQIDVGDGPVRHKYKSARYQIEKLYQEIEEKIKKIQQFQTIYLLHSGRIKKIVVIQFVDFLNYQRSLIAFGNIGVEFNSGGYGLIQDILNFDQEGNTIGQGQSQGDRLDFQNNLLAQKPDLSPIYIKLLNQFLFVSYTEWKTSNYFKHQISQQLFIAFNKDPNESFSKIEVSEMQFSGLPPEIIWLKMLKSDEKEAFFDVNLAFKGKIKFKVNTIYKLFRDIPVEVLIDIEEFYCVIRFCFVPSDIGQGWFSFLGEPISKFKIVPSIANYRFDIETLRTMFNNFLTGKLKKRTYPIKQKISVPASKKDQDLAIIQKRFKAIEQLDSIR